MIIMNSYWIITQPLQNSYRESMQIEERFLRDRGERGLYADLKGA